MAVGDFAIRGNRVAQVTSGAKTMVVETGRPDIRVGMTFSTDTYSIPLQMSEGDDGDPGAVT